MEIFVAYEWFVKGANMCSFELCRLVPSRLPSPRASKVPLAPPYEINRHLLLGMGSTKQEHID